LTSAGLGRDNGNHTRPEWVDLSGPVESGWAGITAFGHPQNFRFPQPVRLHPTMPYFCFAPLVLGDFRLENRKPYRSQFRFVVHDREISVESVNRLWQDYAFPPLAVLQRQ
jgi:hypothetical protein